MIEYQIMQIKDVEHCDYVFRGYKESRFNWADYEVIYEGKLNRVDEQDLDICEILFYMFNATRPKPKDFKGRSLSISDIVVIIDGQHKTAYYCDPIGWVKII